MLNSDHPLVDAAIRAARVICKTKAGGCGGNWCNAQARLRKALEGLAIDWRPLAEQVKDTKGGSSTNP